MSNFSEEELRDLLVLYAMDALPDSEAEEIEHILSERPELWSLVEENRATLGSLTQVAESAPSHVWDAINDAIDGSVAKSTPVSSDTEEVSDVVNLDDRRTQNWMWKAAVAAAVAAVVAFGIGRTSVGTTDPLMVLADEAAARPGAVTANLIADGISAEIVLSPEGDGFLVVDNLPALDASRTYQLWAVTAGGVTSAGVLGSDPGLVAFHTARADEVQALVITEENAGGVITSEGTVIATWGV